MITIELISYICVFQNTFHQRQGVHLCVSVDSLLTYGVTLANFNSRIFQVTLFISVLHLHLEKGRIVRPQQFISCLIINDCTLCFLHLKSIAEHREIWKYWCVDIKYQSQSFACTGILMVGMSQTIHSGPGGINVDTESFWVLKWVHWWQYFTYFIYAGTFCPSLHVMLSTLISLDMDIVVSPVQILK